MPRITKIVITGGPCAGKTTALEVVRKTFADRGYKVITVPEPATELISNGIAPWECSSSEEYQRCQMELQLTRERVYERAASGMKNEKILIVYDRGMLDNKCYMTADEFARVMADLNRTEEQLCQHYDAVFHLVSAAKGARDFYSTENNEIRYESLDEAAQLDGQFVEAWSAHSHLRVIQAQADLAHKLQNLVEEIATFLKSQAEPTPEPNEAHAAPERTRPMRKSKLIKDTTREERMRIVQEALSWGDDECDSLSGMTSGVSEMYQPYIDGELELAECNMRGAASKYVKSDRDRPSTGSCIMGH